LGGSADLRYPGDGINGVIGALQRSDNIEFIQVRHEEMAAFMAVAHAKFTGEIGVCLSTDGPGATHLITGLYDAKLDHAPVLAICGQAEATVRGASYQQELNLDRMFADVAVFAQEASAPAQVRHLIDRCVRMAQANNGPSVIILPKDIQDETFEDPAVAHGFTRSGVIDFFAFGQQPIAGLMNFSCRLQGKDKMVRKVIDFEAAKERHVHQEIDADQAQGELRARLITVMVLSGLSDISLTSVTLNALLTMLQSKGDSPDEAKQRIASALAAFP